MIDVRDIHKSFGAVEVLRGISLQVQDKEIVSIVGKSGAGKTTLLQIMGTLERPQSGEVRIAGEDVWRMKERDLSAFRNRHIGFIFQFHQLLPEFTAEENVMMPALIAGWHTDKAKERAHELLDELQMSHRLLHKPSQMSGGEQQRVAAARALMMSPEVILADEPSGSLDESHKRDLHKLLLHLRERYGQTIVIVTHDKELASMSDRVLEIQDGKIV